MSELYDDYDNEYDDVDDDVDVDDGVDDVDDDDVDNVDDIEDDEDVEEEEEDDDEHDIEDTDIDDDDIDDDNVISNIKDHYVFGISDKKSSNGSTISSRNSHKIFPSITKYEKALIISYRCQQLAEGAKPYINIGNLIDVIDIAEKEFLDDKIPMNIIRHLPLKGGEYIKEVYNISELINL